MNSEKHKYKFLLSDDAVSNSFVLPYTDSVWNVKQAKSANLWFNSCTFYAKCLHYSIADIYEIVLISDVMLCYVTSTLHTIEKQEMTMYLDMNNTSTIIFVILYSSRFKYR